MIRYAVVGAGWISQEAFLPSVSQSGNSCVTAIVSGDSAKANKLAAFYGIPHVVDYGEYDSLLSRDIVDAVYIALPNSMHADYAIRAARAGKHVMVEKPISAHKADAERLIATAQQHPKQVFGGMFQMRVEPRYQKIRKLIQGGELGEIVRINWIITDWFRTEAYYASGGWRATWKGS